MGSRDKSKLLFISNFIPCPTGGGSAIRAFHTLQALSFCFDIGLLFFSMSLRRTPVIHPETKKLCSNIIINAPHPVLDYQYLLQTIWEKTAKKVFSTYSPRTIKLCRGLTPYREKKLQHYFNGKHYHTIHIFRLALYSVFKTIDYVVSHDHLQLDLDDIESDIWSQIKELHHANGNNAQALSAGLRAEAFRKMEETIIPILNQIYVCSEHDSEKLKARFRCRRVSVLPNVYPLTDRKEHIPGTEKFRLLFVGRLGYQPNADAIFYFCDQILPQLRIVGTSLFELLIIGAGKKLPMKTRKKIAQLSELVLVGEVADVGPYYQQADAAIVPLRAGAGTRVKILEAFAWQVPVVSTSIGVEGLEVIHEQHALIADTPLDFARQCARLMTEPMLREHLVQNARSLVTSKYSPERLIEILCR